MLDEVKDFSEKEDKYLNRAVMSILAERRKNGFSTGEMTAAKIDYILCNIMYYYGVGAVKRYVAKYISNPTDELKSAA